MEAAQQPPAKRPHLDENPSKVWYTGEHSKILHGLNEQRKKGLFCDVVLVVGDTRFPAHRSLLVASSDYFNSMFTLDMQESHQKEVKLVCISPDGFKVVLDFLYGEEVSLALDSTVVESILKSAHLLQILKLVDMCYEHLVSDINDENYLRLQELASTYSLETLDESVDYFILKNFQRLSETPTFQDKISLEKLCLYIDSDQVDTRGEVYLQRASMLWSVYRPERLFKLEHILQNIRYSLMPKLYLINVVKPVMIKLNNKFKINVLRFIDEAIDYHYNIEVQPVLQNRRSTPRTPDGEKLLFLGGEETFELQPVEKNVRYLDPKTQKWAPETQLPDWRGDFCVAVLGNYIFCVGGYEIDQTTMFLHNVVYRYDPRWKQWIKVAPMKHCRQAFYLGALKDRLVAVGGEWANHIYSSVETYNPRTNTWFFVAALPSYSKDLTGAGLPFHRSLYNHAGTTHKQHVYISGGEGPRLRMASKALICYDIHTDIWEEKTSMTTCRSHHSMCTLNDRIYAIGGTRGRQSSGHRSVECYNPSSDQWTMVAPLLQQTAYSAAAVWRGNICVLGGMHKLGGTSLKIVQMYDPKEDKWFEGTDLPQRMTRVKACVCILRDIKTP